MNYFLVKPTLIIFLFVVWSSSGYASTINIPADYPTIQAGINAASNGDTILVSPGSYQELIDFLGKAITVKSAAGAEKTIIDGDFVGAPKLRSIVLFDKGEGKDSIIDGFTIKNGTGFFTPFGNRGGGIFALFSSPTIINNIITENSVYDGGGGISCIDSDSVIENNIICNNHAGQFGGGINILCSPTSSPGWSFRNNTIYSNSAGYGGGISIDRSQAIVENNVLFNNSALNGGGILSRRNLTLRNNIIYSNQAKTGGGFFNLFLGAIICNNIFLDNTASFTGGGIACYETTSRTYVSNSIFWNNDAPEGPEISVRNGAKITITHSDVMNGISSVYADPLSTLDWQSGMIDADPMLVDPDGVDNNPLTWNDNDFHILYASPCRDSGDNSSIGLPAMDNERDPRIAYGTVDIGSDEFNTHLYYTGNSTPGGIVSLNLVDIPNSTPVIVFIGSGVIDPPYHFKKYGDFFLQPPLLAQISLGTIPRPTGILTFSYKFDANFPIIDIPMQALIGSKLTNLCVMEVK